MAPPLLSRRSALSALAMGAVGFAAGGWAKTRPPEPKVIKVSARRFSFTPSILNLKKGRPVTLELSTEDVLMGFAAPDFGVRSDILPGQITRLTFTPDKAGSFVFLCDVFCGSGHENMNGTIHVTEK